MQRRQSQAFSSGVQYQEKSQWVQTQEIPSEHQMPFLTVQAAKHSLQLINSLQNALTKSIWRYSPFLLKFMKTYINSCIIFIG